jgi:hypothetical protein
MNIGVFPVYHATCPRCGCYIPIRPSSLLPPEKDPRWREMDDDPVVFACNDCRRVYSVNKGELVERPTMMGVGPNAPGAPTTVFQVPIECDSVSCESRLLVHAALKSNTTAAEIADTTHGWTVVEIRCSDHDFQWPPFPHPR